MPQGTCSVEGCDRDAAHRGWCSRHYQRWRKSGDPLFTKGTPPGLTPMERFMRFVEIDPATGCWNWTGGSRDGRYGSFSATGRQGSLVMAHRWIYEQAVGPIPDGMHLDHFRCERTMCVNPKHVRPVTPRENSLRADSLAARNLAKTHCIYGHPLSGDNLHVLADGERRCRTCINERAARYRAAKRQS